MKNVIFMGTPDFAVPTLEALIASRYHVQAVFTQPDKPQGRKGQIVPTPVKQTAMEAGIPVHQPRRIRDAESLELLRAYAPDVIVVTAFGQIIPRTILTLPRYGCINVHASLLPAYRGAAPIQWAVIDGVKESGVTTMQMSEGLDTGDMLLQTKVTLDPQETGGSLFDKLSAAGARLLIETLEQLEAGTVTPVKQPDQSPTPYAAMLTRQMGHVDWTKSAAQIERLIRGLSPWPSAYTFLEGRQLKLWKAQVLPENTAQSPGTVIVAEKGQLQVQTGDGILAVKELQLEGKKRMETDAFLRGFPVRAGTRLGTA